MDWNAVGALAELLGAIGVIASLVYLLAQQALIAAGGGHVPWSLRSQASLLLPRVVLNLVWFPALFFPLRAVARRIGGPRIGFGWEG